MQIDDLLRRLGVTKKELALRMGVTPTSINSYLKNPTESNIRLIAGALNVPIGLLFNEKSTDLYGVVCPHCGKLLPLSVKITCSPTGEATDEQ